MNNNFPTYTKIFEETQIRLKEIRKICSQNKEIIDYGNSLIELYEKLLHIVKPNLSFNPMIPDNPTKKIRTVNLDKYFKG